MIPDGVNSGTTLNKPGSTTRVFCFISSILRCRIKARTSAGVLKYSCSRPGLLQVCFSAPVSFICVVARHATPGIAPLCPRSSNAATAQMNGIPKGRVSAGALKYACSKPHGGDLASTRVAKPKVHAELQITRKTDCKLLVANDDNYALAA